jgi:hypothetical protein
MTEHAVVIAGGGPTGRMLAGELAFSGSKPNTRGCGSFRRLGRSQLPPPFWFGPTDMWPGWETQLGLADALTTWFGPPTAP